MKSSKSPEGSNIVKVGVGYTVGNYLLKGVSFLTTPIFARLMTTADFGKYSVFVSCESILFVILGFAIHSSYKNAYYKYRNPCADNDEYGYQQYVAATMYLIIFSTLFWVLVALLFNKIICDYMGLDPELPFLIVGMSYTTSVVSCYSADRGIHYQYKPLLMTSLLNISLGVATSLVLINTVFVDKMYMGRILGLVIPGLVIYSLIAVKFIARASIQGMWKPLLWGVKYSLPIIPHGLGQIILGQFDRLMIQEIVGISEAGIYSFAYTIYSMITVASDSIGGIWSPYFYKKRSAEDFKSIKKASSIYTIIVWFASVFVIMMCPELIAFLGGVKYRDAVYCAIPIVVGGFFSCIYCIPCLVEYYHEKTKGIAVCTMVAAGINILLNAVFIPKYGYVAAAYTTLFTYVLYFVVHFCMAIRLEGKNLFSIGSITVCSVSLGLSSVVSLLAIDNILIRTAFFSALMSITAIYLGKSLLATELCSWWKLNGKNEQ